MGYTSDCMENGGADWWLRSPGENSECACMVGYISSAGAYYSFDVNSVYYAVYIGVRPAMYLKK